MSVTFSYYTPKTVARLSVNAQHNGQCHCGAVKFSVALPEGLPDLARCNCSLCSKRGAIMGFIEQSRFSILQGAEHLTLYQFNSHIAKHYFCSICGIYTHHQRRSIPTQYAFNIACLEGVDPYSVTSVPIIDGANRHPSDGG